MPCQSSSSPSKGSKLEILSRAREIINKRENWTRKVWAADKNGVSVQPDSSSATCWCAIGALVKAQGELGATDAQRVAAQMELRNAMRWPVMTYNDWHMHDEVLAKFDEAIKCAISSQPSS